MAGDTFGQFEPEDQHFKALLRIACLNTDAIFLVSSSASHLFTHHSWHAPQRRHVPFLAPSLNLLFCPGQDDKADILKRATKGDASESAMIKFVQGVRDIMQYRGSCKRHTAIPFNSSNKVTLCPPRVALNKALLARVVGSG